MRKNAKINAARFINRGVSLIELIIVIVLASIVVLIGAALVSQSGRSFASVEDLTEAGWQGRVAFERMEREVRAIASTASITTWTAAALTFTTTGGTSIGYTFSGGSLQRTQAPPVAAVQPQPLADYVSSLGFTYWDRSGVQVIPGVGSVSNIYYITVTLTISKGDFSTTYRTTVFPSSFS